MASQLNPMQRWIVQQLRRDQCLPKQPDAIAGSEQYLTGNERLSPAEQLEIYRVQFWLRHTSALLDDYPGVSGILGQAEWEKLVESYLSSYAPDSWTLRDLGRRFAEHIAARAETPHRALCEDMAKLEWLYTELFDAEDVPPLDRSKLASLPESAWQSAHMVFNPAFRLLQVRYPVAKLRMQLKASADDAQGPAVEIPKPQAQNLALYRNHQRRLFHQVISDVAYFLLQQLHSGVPLVPAAEQTVERFPQHAEAIGSQLGTWFQDWGARGFIVDVET